MKGERVRFERERERERMGLKRKNGGDLKGRRV